MHVHYKDVSPGLMTLTLILVNNAGALHCILFYLCQVPDSASKWKAVESVFSSRWQLPHCIGAIDGKHIRIMKPFHSGSQFFNYKGFFSIVLMAVVDADYQFLYVDVGAEGRMSDGGVFAHCSLFTALEDRLLNIPDAEPLSNTCHMAVPYYLAGDEAFPLKPFLMKPYSRRALTVEEQTCNYRFSRGRMVVEHAFGMLASVFRILHTPIHLQPQKAELIVLAVCVLHNFLRQRCKNAYLPPVAGSIGPTVEGLVPLEFTQHRNATNAAKEVRDVLKQYFMTEGQLSWQQERLLQF